LRPQLIITASQDFSQAGGKKKHWTLGKTSRKLTFLAHLRCSESLQFRTSR
jgi:hypothetical protein